MPVLGAEGLFVGLRFYLSTGLGRPVKGSRPMRHGWNVQHALPLACFVGENCRGRVGGAGVGSGEASVGRRPPQLSR